MQILTIQSAIGSSKILVGETLENVCNYIPRDKKVAIITDSNIIRLYGEKLPPYPVIDMGVGEEVKTLDTVAAIYRELTDLEFDRYSFILAIGGGIVCDTAGYVASTYMRGVEFGFVSTTLLAQVDASVGGKNGVNFQGFKNMIGNFNLPGFVICDMNMLKTLSLDDIQCGMAEVVKHGAIKDDGLFSYIESNHEKAVRLDDEVISRLVYDSVVIKSNVVNADAREAGDRRKLNFGHTFGHAVEKVTRVPHGVAVSIGMVVAAQLSVTLGLLPQEKADRLNNLLVNLGLPISMEFDKEAAISALRRDKKRQGEVIHFVLLEDIGRAVVKEIRISDLENVIRS